MELEMVTMCTVIFEPLLSCLTLVSEPSSPLLPVSKTSEPSPSSLLGRSLLEHSKKYIGGMSTVFNDSFQRLQCSLPSPGSENEQYHCYEKRRCDT